jgi:4-amino-4-deoxy-L-arabinose transferase-like glycosyltransferase
MNKRFLITLIIALIIKLSLFIYAEIYSPVTKFAFDTTMYDEAARCLIDHGVFARESQEGTFSPETFRTPGYPLFLGVLHYLLKIPFSGVIVIQILLTILIAFITYRTAMNINPNLGYLSFLIVLFDPPVTIFSLMLLTETLFLFIISLFMAAFILYLRNKKIKFIILSALFTAMAAYVRPLAYFLGIAMVIFLIYVLIRTKLKKVIIHTLIFIIITYGLIGLWQFRNYKVTGNKNFTTHFEFSYHYRKNIRKDDAITRSLPPALYYLNAYSRCFMSLITNPGTLKNFDSHALKRIGKIIFYPWMVFWLIGFLVGISKIKRDDICLQFLLFIVLYFICASVGGILFGVSSRMRVPMVPFIAILSANGWIRLAKRKEKDCKI